MKGAGGSSGGTARFFIGLFMIIGGGYLFLDTVRIGYGFGGHGLYRIGGYTLTGGMVLIPLIFGVGFIFYNAKNPFGWILAGGSLLAFLFGIIRSVRFNMAGISAFELIMMLVLIFGGLGLFVSSLREYK